MYGVWFNRLIGIWHVSFDFHWLEPDGMEGRDLQKLIT